MKYNFKPVYSNGLIYSSTDSQTRDTQVNI